MKLIQSDSFTPPECIVKETLIIIAKNIVNKLVNKWKIFRIIDENEKAM